MQLKCRERFFETTNNLRFVGGKILILKHAGYINNNEMFKTGLQYFMVVHEVLISKITS